MVYLHYEVGDTIKNPEDRDELTLVEGSESADFNDSAQITKRWRIYNYRSSPEVIVVSYELNEHERQFGYEENTTNEWEVEWCFKGFSIQDCWLHTDDGTEPVEPDFALEVYGTQAVMSWNDFPVEVVDVTPRNNTVTIEVKRSVNLSEVDMDSLTPEEQESLNHRLENRIETYTFRYDTTEEIDMSTLQAPEREDHSEVDLEVVEDAVNEFREIVQVHKGNTTPL